MRDLMQTELSIEIDRPIAEVFDYTNNNITEWSITVVAVEILDEKPEGVGTTFRCVTEDKGRRMDFDGVTTRYEPPTASAVYLTR